MRSALFSLTQKVENIDNLKTKHSWNWTIPDFMWLLNNQTNRDIRTKTLDLKDYNNEECKLQVKIQFLGHENDFIEIYYKTDQSVGIESKCSIWTAVSDPVRLTPQHVNLAPQPACSQNFGSGVGQATRYIVISNKVYQFVPKNEWQLLAVLFKRDLQIERTLPDNNMSLLFEFVVCENKIKTNVTKLPSFAVNEKEEFCTPMMADRTITTSLMTLLMNAAFSDVTVKSLEGHEFPAHKNILAISSFVFKAHFAHNITESRTSVVDIPFETKVVKDLLIYIYTACAPRVNALSQKLLKAADFYQLNGLKGLCERELEKQLTVENAIETLELANLYKTMYLKRKTLEFIKDGLTGDITKTESWKISQSAEVIKSIYECIVTNKTC